MRTRVGFFMPEQKIFEKPALAIEQQIALLKKRGLIIDDVVPAEHFLQTIGYYRLMAYFKSFLVDRTDSEKGFKSNISFSNILQLYIFDRELRLLVVDALERIEVALRAAISNTMSIKYGTHWYQEPTLFINHDRHASFLIEAFEYLKRSNEDFIEKYYATYDNPPHPPSWMLMECLSFGTISKIYHNLKDRSARKVIGDIFGQYSETVKSWMRALTFTRNVCAHHSRLWNRFFINTPKNADIPIKINRDRSPFVMQAYIIITLLNEIAPHHHWKMRLYELFENNPSIPFNEMGFSVNWRNDRIWNL